MLDMTLDSFKNNADKQFIEKNCFDWIIDTYLAKRSATDFISYLENKIEEEISSYIFLFRVDSLLIQSSFVVGKVEFLNFDDLQPEEIFNAINETTIYSQDEFDSIYKDFRNIVLAKTTVYALRDKAEQIAKKEVSTSLNALKCSLLNESIDFSVQITDADFNMPRQEMSKFLSVNVKSPKSYNINLQNNFGPRPTDLTNEKLDFMEKLCLNHLSKFLVGDKNGELDEELLNSIDQYGIAMSHRNLYDRIVRVVSVIERLVVPKNSAKSKAQTILLKKVIPKLPYDDHSSIKQIINRNYNTYPMDKMINELSDYFEREDDKQPAKISNVIDNDFNRQQFLKD
ncbi:MAG: hypothetical protein IH948_05595, partial [Bacteroidetes bacterium]|nr:hypothetical protein [Bacteroidota bacterium]